VTVCAQDPVSQLESCIADRVGPQRYSLWFKNATSFLLADGMLKIGVPNLFIGGWIENHFTDTIAEAAESVTGKRPELIFSIDPSLARRLRKKQPDSQLAYAVRNPEREARQRIRNGAPPRAQALRKHFDTFVVGDSNRMAYTAARAVAERSATCYNPLFIHAGCGLGKTHLLQAICNTLRQRNPEMICVYLTGEDFLNHFVYAVKGGNRDAFQHRYRSADVLIIDDIHFFAKKQGTQEEFLHTYNAIDSAGKQVVLSSDAHPKLIGHLSESLVTRFVSGMVVRIDPPDYVTRAEILRRRMAAAGVSFPAAVIEYVAQNIQANVRELEGALARLIALSQMERHPLTVEDTRRGLRDLIRQTGPAVRASNIQSLVALYFGLLPADLHTSRKSRTIALARGIAMYLTRKHTDLSFPEIGRSFGNKDHTTVILACRRIGRLLESGDRARWTTASGKRERLIVELMEELEGQIGNGQTAA